MMMIMMMMMMMMMMIDDDDDYDEKQAQWFTLQLCLETVAVTEWIECSRFNHLF